MKYILGEIGFAIFDDGQTHEKMARMMSSKPKSAGFVTLDREGKFKCYGESISLGLKSEEGDSEKLNYNAENY